MTHEELLALIKEKDLSYSHPDSVFTMNDKTNHALRAVVELHKPLQGLVNEPFTCQACRFTIGNPVYPCPTIQAIEKELI